jgi:hypothetical protein
VPERLQLSELPAQGFYTVIQQPISNSAPAESIVTSVVLVFLSICLNFMIV